MKRRCRHDPRRRDSRRSTFGSRATSSSAPSRTRSRQGSARGRRPRSADAGIVTGETGLDAWVACRGSLMPTSVPGRPGHPGVGQPHWREGGAVNAIEKARIVMDALRGSRGVARGSTTSVSRRRRRSDRDLGRGVDGELPEPLLPHRLPRRLPARACGRGVGGTKVEREIVEWLERADRRLAEDPLIQWAPEVPSSEAPPDHPIVGQPWLPARTSEPGRVTGMDSWHDGATFTRFGGTPSICSAPASCAGAHDRRERGRERGAALALRFWGFSLSARGRRPRRCCRRDRGRTRRSRSGGTAAEGRGAVVSATCDESGFVELVHHASRSRPERRQ